MERIQQQLMYCLAAYRLGDKQAQTVQGMTPADWGALHDLAMIHKMEAIVLDTLWQDPAFCADSPELRALWKKQAVRQAVQQTLHSRCVMQLGALLTQNQIPYAVVKGLVCRELYARPDLRVSGDEDVYILPQDQKRCARLLEENGFCKVALGTEQDVTHWMDHQTGLHVELHTHLIAAEQEQAVWLDQLFAAGLADGVEIPVTDGVIRTLQPTLHFVFLVCHALKHFLTGGFGIRTLCDMVAFADRYRTEIDFAQASALLERVRAKIFLDQIFAVGQHWLGFDPAEIGWRFSAPPQELPLLQDCLDAGVYGQSTMSRKHSAGLVLEAGESRGRLRQVTGVLFPPREKLAGKYPQLNQHPALLPACWAHRLGKYALEVARNTGRENSPRESLELGRQRAAMMVQYGIFPERSKKK